MPKRFNAACISFITNYQQPSITTITFEIEQIEEDSDRSDDDDDYDDDDDGQVEKSRQLIKECEGEREREKKKSENDRTARIGARRRPAEDEDKGERREKKSGDLCPICGVRDVPKM